MKSSMGVGGSRGFVAATNQVRISSGAVTESVSSHIDTDKERVYNRFSSRGQHGRTPSLSLKQSSGFPLSPVAATPNPAHPHQLQPIENMYNLQFCNPLSQNMQNQFRPKNQLQNATGINLESSQDHGQLEGESSFIPAGASTTKHGNQRILNFNKVLNNARRSVNKGSE